MNQQQGHWWLRLIDPIWEVKAGPCILIQHSSQCMSDCIKVDAGSDRKLSDYREIHVEAYKLSIVADYVHPLMEMVFPDGCCVLEQDNAPCPKARVD